MLQSQSKCRALVLFSAGGPRGVLGVQHQPGELGAERRAVVGARAPPAHVPARPQRAHL